MCCSPYPDVPDFVSCNRHGIILKHSKIGQLSWLGAPGIFSTRSEYAASIAMITLVMVNAARIGNQL